MAVKSALRGEDLRGRLPHVLDGLSEDELRCLELRYAQRLRHQAIADALGLPLADVARTISAAMRKVAVAIENGARALD